ncbi:MAG: hypothetical protein CVV27_11700 [Candidatus Melainabacteria bacterium HGW-Melainabacteria-1]|nr:MAG: hypothetical protein CVV27_11700 [Candidatus Melainabacteria bacterium HGW-Melainabacteria-1]
MRTSLLQEESEELKVLLDRKGYDYRDGADPAILDALGRPGLPVAYRHFLAQLDPGDGAWRIGGQFTVVLHSADELADWQDDAAESGQFVIGTLNGETLVIKGMDGDSPIYRLTEDGMVCVASSLIQFLRIVRTGLEMLGKLEDYDEEGEDEGDEGYDDMDDYEAGAFASGREDIVNDYLEELESIDPDCAEAWAPA